MQHKAFSGDITISDGDERTFTATITTDRLDRDREVLIPGGLNAKDYEKNPVIYWNHDYSRPPVGLCLGLKRASDRWSAKGQLAARPENHVGEWLPDTLHSLMKQRVLRGVSVGFEPSVSRNPTAKDREDFGDEIQRVHAKWHLLEYSLCGLMANQDALVEAVSKGVVTSERCKSLFDIDIQPKPRKVMIVMERPTPPRARRFVDIRPLVAKSVSRQMARQVGHIFVK